MRNFLLTLAVLSLVTSCGLYSKYQRPENIQTDSLYGALYENQEDTSSISDMSWKELFTDPYLAGLIEKGLSANTDLQRALLDIEKAESALKSAKLAWLPSFNLTPNGSVGQFNNWESVTTTPSWTYSLSAACSWEIEIFGKFTNTRREAEESREMARNYELAVKTGLISAIANQYYTLVMLDRQLQLATETEKRFESSVRVLTSMKKAGMVTDIAVNEMKGAYYGVTTSISDIRKSISNLETTLCQTLSETPHSIERSTLESMVFPEKLKTGVSASLLSRRPDVRAAENSLAASYYAVNVARANLYPSLTLGGSAGWTNDLGSSIINPGGLLLGAAASIYQPIFNSRALKTNLEIARANKKQAELSFQQTVLDAGAEVNKALTQYQTALSKEESRKLQVESLKAAVKSTNLLMKNSSTTYLEVLVAEENLLSAQTSESQDQFEKIEAVINLYRALGGGQR